jgi:hypothetical protein
MANISIGTVTLDHNPTKMTIVREQKSCAAVDTYSSVAFFSWGTSIIGKEIDLEFSYVDSAIFDDLDDLYKADAPVVFNPQDGSNKTFNVEIMNLDGDYHRTLDVTSGHLRKNVKMTLLILSEVVTP